MPFNLINHIKHKANGQPVANMWNSMMYQDNTGYHVAKIYCEHPVLSSLLVTFRAETHVNYKSQLRIPTSGNTVYSASSYGSQNLKAHDPRSATRVNIHRSGNRNQWSGSNRNATQGQSWRRNDIQPKPSRYQPQLGDTPTQDATHRRGMLQPDTSRASASPPHFMLPNNPHTSTAGVVNDARSFTTADDRMLASFAESRGAKRSDAGSSSSDREADKQAEDTRTEPSNHRGAFQGGRTSRMVHQRTPPRPVNSSWRGAGMNPRDGNEGHTNVQWQNDGRAAQVPVLNPVHGFHSAHKNAGDQLSLRTATMPIHLPSPVASSQHSGGGSSPQANEPHGQISQNLPGSFMSPQHNNFAQNYARPTSKFPHRTFHGRALVKSGGLMKHSHSMPAMDQKVTQRLSAQRLRAQAAAFEPESLGAQATRSPSIQDWVIETPSRTAFEIEPSSSSSSGQLPLINTIVAALEYSPDKYATNTQHLDMEQKLKWYKARVSMLEAEIKLAGSTADLVATLKWYRAKVDMLEVDIIAAHKEHEVARGDLAQPTDDHPPQSPTTPHNSAHWPKKASGSSVESALIAPLVDDNGKICRSVSKSRLEKRTHVGQKIRHRRGNISTEGFTGSFDARMNANVEGLLASPTRSGTYPIGLPAHTHAHPPQQRHSARLASGHLAAAQMDSCTEGQHQQVGEYCRDESPNITSPTSMTGEDDDVFSPRGRGYHNMQSPSTRDVSQVSNTGGIWLQGQGGYGYE